MKYLTILALIAVSFSIQAQAVTTSTGIQYVELNEEAISVLDDATTIQLGGTVWSYHYNIAKNRWYLTSNLGYGRKTFRSFRGVVRRIAKDLDMWSFRHTKTATALNTLFPQFKAVGF